MSTLIETSRLIIRPILPQDEEGMFQMDSNPEVHRYLGGRYYKFLDESRNMISIIRQQYQDFSIGRWAILKKDDGDFIGWVGFRFMPGPVNRHSNYYDFGYRLRQEYWGHGYATEAAVAALQYGRSTLNLKHIFAMTDPENIVSRHILEKIGFHLVEIFEYDVEPSWRTPNEPTTWYELKG